MGNNIQSCQPSLTRERYYPGNPIEGNVKVVTTADVEYYAIRVAICSVAWYEYEEGSGNDRRTVTSTNVFSKTIITVAGDCEQVAAQRKSKHKLGMGTHNFPFRAVLSPATLPSAYIKSGCDKAKLFHYVEAVVDVAGRLNQAGKVIFTVFSPVPVQKWQMPSPSSIQKDFAVNCCCHCCCPCFSHGKIHAKAQIDKSCVSMDRDEINFTAHIDNSGSSEKITGVNAVIQCFVTPKIGPKTRRFNQVLFNQKIPIVIEGGKTGDVSGKIKLAPGAPPTITSAVVDWKVCFVLVVEESGCTTVNPRVPIDIELFHTVDESGAAQYIQQQQMSFQPILNMNAPMAPGMFEVPNMSQSNFISSMPPPPPPGMMPPPGYAYQAPTTPQQQQQDMMNANPQMGYGATAEYNAYQDNNNNNNNNFTPNNGGVPPPPPPPPGGVFPGFAQFPDSDYFVQAHNSNSQHQV